MDEFREVFGSGMGNSLLIDFRPGCILEFFYSLTW